MKYLFSLCVLCCLLSWCTWGVIVDDSVDISTGGDVLTTGQVFSGDVMTIEISSWNDIVIDDGYFSRSTLLGWSRTWWSDTIASSWSVIRTYAWIMNIYPKNDTYFIDLDYLTALTCKDILKNPYFKESDEESFCSNKPLDSIAEWAGGWPIFDNRSRRVRTFALTATKIQLIDTKAAEAWLTESGLVPVSAKDLYTALMIDPAKAAYHRGMEFLPTRSRTEDPNDLFRVVESADHRLLSLEQERLP